MSASSPVVGSVVSGWIACGFDDVTLLIPMEDAGARMDAEDLVPTAEGLELGMLRWQDELWPAYRLNRELAPVTWEATPTAVVCQTDRSAHQSTGISAVSTLRVTPGILQTT